MRRPALLRLAALAAALAASAVAPAAAVAAISVDRFSLTPADNRAGVRTRVDLHAEFSTNDALHGLVVHLPPGLVGNPLAVPRCPQAQFRDATCPRDTRVGAATVTTALLLAGTAGGGVFNLEPSPGEPARLGIALTPAAPLPAQKLIARVGLRSDGGIDTTIDNIPATAGAVRSIDLSLGGENAPPFITLPTGCATVTTTIEATSAGGARGSASSAFTPQQCERLPFRPELTVTMNRRGPRGSRSYPGLRTQLIVPPGSAAIRLLRVTLPARLGLDFSRAHAVCTAEQARADACPAAARIGSASALSPVLAGPLTGAVHLTAVDGSLLPGLRLSLGGAVQLRFQATTEVTTGVTTAFDGLPDLPVDRLGLTLAGAGPLRVLGDPCTGEPLRMAMSATGHNGATAAAPARVRISGCPIVATVRLRKGSRPLTITVHRGRDAAKLKRIVVHLPRGMRAGRSRTVSRTLRRSRPGATLRLRRGTVSGRPHGSFRIVAVGIDGRRSAVRVKPLR